MNQSFGYNCPTFLQNHRAIGIMANKIKKETYTAGSFPMQKIPVHKLSRALFIAKMMCSRIVQIFLNKFMMFTRIFKAKMTAQMLKNNPGGVTYREYLFEI